MGYISAAVRRAVWLVTFSIIYFSSVVGCFSQFPGKFWLCFPIRFWYCWVFSDCSVFQEKENVWDKSVGGRGNLADGVGTLWQAHMGIYTLL